MLYNKYEESVNGEVLMSSSENNKKKEEKKEEKTAGLIWLKEGVAAFLAVSIILATLFFLAPSLTANPADSTSAQAVFAVLGGWGGVVIGYYFGRIPAEKAADKAEKVADSARAERDTAEKSKVKEIIESTANYENYQKKLDAAYEALEAVKAFIEKKGENK